MIATKFDGSKLAEAIEDKKLPEIIKAARASIEAKNKAAKAAEENKDKENEKDKAKDKDKAQNNDKAKDGEKDNKDKEKDNKGKEKEPVKKGPVME